ncbi:hypothetical protein E4U43_003573 [Claviceps pusilla]|uniref:YAG7-like dimerisation domain-containing protein n=1 Tax=Claviceps pusilla TaxID=123648 RepID=A0A9P7T0I0_9HYPO|nr:hypothetical protein E4U43_003573 [Claviceps pusilla]
MAASATQSAPKASKKKLANAIERVNSPAPSAGSGAAADSQDEGYESPYIKELQNFFGLKTNASKTDSILRQHVGTPLEELVISRVINTDQKVQIEKKPALQAQLTQMEQQLAQFQKVHEQYRSRAAADKAEWEKSLEKAKEDAVSETKAGFQQSLKDSLLTLSQFLRLAAYRREEASEPESDESQAIEGVLLAIYAGDENAVSSMLKLVQGTDDKVFSVPGEELQTTYSVVKTLATEYKTPLCEGTPQPDGAPPEASVTDAAPAPAVDGEATAEIAAGEASTVGEQDVSANGSVTVDAASAMAESHCDTENGLSASQEWVDVKVPHESSEAETQPDASPLSPPAATTQSKSWADDQPEQAALEPHSNPNEAHDGFHSVPRNKSRQDREGSGSWRGRGRGEHRGRGAHRGDMRGRGRGRGGVPSRPRRNEESS